MFPLAGFIAGILFADYLSYSIATLLIVVAIAMLIARRRMPEWCRQIALFLLFSGFGAADMLWQAPPEIIAVPTTKIVNMGEVEECRVGDRGLEMRIHRYASRDIPAVDMTVSTGHMYSDHIEPGDIVRFRAITNPLRKDTRSDESSYDDKKLLEGVRLSAYTPELEVVGHTNSWRTMAWKCRIRLIGLLCRTRLSTDAVGFLSATIAGDASMLPDETRAVFSAAGVAHVLALSGLHVGIIVMIVTLLFLPLNLIFDWRVGIGAVIVVLWGYAFITGLSPSVTRSVTMATLVGGGIIMQRPYASINGLFVAALLILAVEPAQLWGVGFQLSFLAVIAILLLTPQIYERLGGAHPVVRWFVSSLLLTISAMIGTSMVAAYYFHTFPLYSILANLPIVAILPLLMVGGAAIMILQAMGIEVLWLIQSIDAIYSAMEQFAVWIASLPGAVVTGVHFPGWLLVPYFATVAVGCLALWRKRLVWGAVCLLGIIVTAIAMRHTMVTPAPGEVFMPYDSRHTSLIWHRADGRVAMLSTAPTTVAASLRREYEHRYSDYLLRRNTDSLEMLPKARAIPGIILATSKLNKRNVSKLKRTMHRAPELVVICRGYRGSWRMIADSLAPRRIVLSADIHSRLHMRLYDSITTAGYPVLSARSKPYSPLTLPR